MASNDAETKLKSLLMDLNAACRNVKSKHEAREKSLVQVRDVLRTDRERRQRSKFKNELVQSANAAIDEIVAIRECLEALNAVKSARNEQIAALSRAKPIVRRGLLMNILNHHATGIPTWTGSIDEPVPPLCGRIPAAPNFIAPRGQLVAARVGQANSSKDEASAGAGESASKRSPSKRESKAKHSGNEADLKRVKVEEPALAAGLVEDGEEDEETNWILAEVVSSERENGTLWYKVLDIDAEPGAGCSRLPARDVVVLPIFKYNPLLLANRSLYGDPPALHPSAIESSVRFENDLKRRRVDGDANDANERSRNEPLFERGAHVLALYPQTTCFYAGIVVEPPHRVEDGYSVVFADANYPGGYSPPLSIPQRFVIDYRD